jgi:dTDP-4-amino-4,6-dideoxygalactose transaminase
MRRDGSHIYLYYPLQCADRDGLARFMTRHLRDVQISHHRNCAGLECFSTYARDCPNAERAARSLLYLPTYPGYREDQVKANIAAIRAYFREANSWA